MPPLNDGVALACSMYHTLDLLGFVLHHLRSVLERQSNHLLVLTRSVVKSYAQQIMEKCPQKFDDLADVVWDKRYSCL